jgi:hypothetical protein
LNDARGGFITDELFTKRWRLVAWLLKSLPDALDHPI